MHKYQYHGDEEREVPGYGIVKPKEKFESEVVINHPDFELLNDESTPEKKKEEIHSDRTPEGLKQEGEAREQ